MNVNDILVTERKVFLSADMRRNMACTLMEIPISINPIKIACMTDEQIIACHRVYFPVTFDVA